MMVVSLLPFLQYRIWSRWWVFCYSWSI